MPDIIKCTGKECLLKDKCYRYTAVSKKFWQSFMNPTYKNGKCDHFWDNKDKKEIKENK